MLNFARSDDRRVTMHPLKVSRHGLQAALYSSALSHIFPALARLRSSRN